MKKLKIGLDFDGVLHSYTSGWTGHKPEDPPMEGALEFVNDLKKRGHKLVIISSRADKQEGIDGIKNWLEKHGFPKIPVHYNKLPCHLYIDDNGFRFDNNFDQAIRFIDSGL